MYSTASELAARAPDLLQPVVGFRDWRVTGDGLESPRTGTVWGSRVIQATCHPRNVEDFVLPPHEAPHPACNCGVHASHRLNDQAAKVDYRGVSGIVSLWGLIQVHDEGMRAQYARVEALGVYARWTRRQRDAVLEVADRLGCDLVELGDLAEAAARYGAPLPEVLRHPDGNGAASRRPHIRSVLAAR
jgi:hypothetical protein